MVFGVVAFSGCSQKEVEVKAPAEVKKVVAEVNATAAVVEKAAPVAPAAPKVGGGATHVPFSEMMK